MNAEHAEVDKDAQELVACVVWALKFLHTKSGSGCVLRHVEGKHSLESFQIWFQRALKPYGVEFDTDLLRYQRASQKDRKAMEKDAAFSKKLSEARALK